MPQAESIYKKILQSNPNQPVALHLLGVIAHQTGKYDTAVDLISKALTIKPDYAEAHCSLGLVLKDHGKLDEAVASYHKALTIKPDYAKAHYDLGNALKDLGKLDEGVASYHKALTIKPDYAKAHSNLGNALKDLGKLDEAVASYHKALTIKPDLAMAHCNLGAALQEQGKPVEAFEAHRRAITLNPGIDSFWAGWASTLENLSFSSVDDNLLRDLLLLLERPTVNPAHVIQPIISALRNDPEFSRILGSTGAGDQEDGIAYGELARQLSSIPLFLRIMGLSPILDLEIERMLTHLRRAAIQETMVGNTSEEGLPFLVALALQCFTNEYIFTETDEEKAAVEQFQQQIAALVEKKRDVPPPLVAALGAYRPLHSFPWAQDLYERDWTGDIGRVIDQQISEPVKERSLRSRIPSLTPIENTISQSVREQYEENPYPRWIKTEMRDKGSAIGAELQRAPLCLDLGDYESPESPEILVAGCGTGQHALNTAARFSKARVLAVDLSLSSLSYAWRKTDELNVSNIDYAQADILELGTLGRRFDIIECGGVLHHLGDPLAGWRVLVDLLRPGGLMMIGLYSEIARQHITSGQRLIAEQGYTASPEDIRRCRQDIIAQAKDGNRKMMKICNSRNFFSLSECRDLLFHVQEHRFTLPQIQAALEALKLKFLGFELRDQTVLSKFRKSYPSRSELNSLSLWHKYELENPDSFQRMYQFWCKKI